MKAGLLLSCLHPLQANMELAKTCEQAGFTDLWLPDHLMGMFHPDIWPNIDLSAEVPDADGWLDPFCMAALLSQHCNLPIGTAVTDGVRRRAPDLGRTMLTLQQMNSAGFNLGIGVGEAESTLPFGYDFEKPVGKLEKLLEELTCLLNTGNMPEGPGRIGLPRTSEAGRPQIWIAGMQARMLRLTASYADGWLPTGLTPEYYAASLEIIRTIASGLQRPMPRASLLISCMFGESADKVMQELEQNPLLRLIMLMAPAALWKAHGIEHPAGPDALGFPNVIPHELDPAEMRKAAARIPPEILDQFLYLGNANEIAERLSAFSDTGLEHVVILNYNSMGGPLKTSTDPVDELKKLPELLAEL